MRRRARVMLLASLLGLGGLGAALAWRALLSPAPGPAVERWSAYKKNENGIQKRVPKAQELASSLGPGAIDRGPASGPAHSNTSSTSLSQGSRAPRAWATYQDRLVLDAASRASTTLPEIQEFENSVSPAWKDHLAQGLLRHHDDGTQVYVEHEKSLLQVQAKRGRYLEQVVVNYLRPDGRRSSFRALVDADTGEVLRTWDRSLSEDYRRSSLTFTPAR